MKRSYLIGVLCAGAFSFLAMPSSALAAAASNVKCDGCVNKSDIKDIAVTTSKIRDGAVTTSKIGDGTIVTSKIGDGAITVDKLSAEVVDAINQQGGSSQPQFVGFTTDTFDGGQGMVTYTNACDLDYTGSHMCASEEFLNSNSFPASSGAGWIRPTFVPVAGTSNSTSEVIHALDMSGVSSISSLACHGWSYSATGGISGLEVDFSGKFRAASCISSKAVACCM